MAKNALTSKIAVNLPRALHTAVRRKAFDERKTWETVVCEALELWLGGEVDSVGSKLTNDSDGSKVSVVSSDSFSAEEPGSFIESSVRQLSMRDLLKAAEEKVEKEWAEPVEVVTPVEVVSEDWFPGPIGFVPDKEPEESLESVVAEELTPPTDTVIENEKPQEEEPPKATSDDDLFAGLFDDL